MLITTKIIHASMAIAMPPSQLVLKLALKTQIQAKRAKINAIMYAAEPISAPRK